MPPTAGEVRVAAGWRRLGPVLPSGRFGRVALVVSEAAGAVVAAGFTDEDCGELVVSVSRVDDGGGARTCSVTWQPHLFMGVSAVADAAGGVWLCWGKTLVWVDARSGTAQPIRLPDDGLVASGDLIGAGQGVAVAVDRSGRVHVLRLFDDSLWIYDPVRRAWSVSALSPELIPTEHGAGLALVGDQPIVTGAVCGPGGLRRGPPGQPVFGQRSVHGSKVLPLRDGGAVCLDEDRARRLSADGTLASTHTLPLRVTGTTGLTEAGDGVLAIWGQPSSDGCPITLVALTPGRATATVHGPETWLPAGRFLGGPPGYQPRTRMVPPAWTDLTILALAGSRSRALFALFADPPTGQISMWRHTT